MLIAFAGFRSQGPILDALKSYYDDGTVRFVDLLPFNLEEAPVKYLHRMANAINRDIFGRFPIADFCVPKTDSCALDGAEVRGRCRGHAEMLACERRRPATVLVVCHPGLYEDAFDLLGRAVLLFRWNADELKYDADFLRFLDEALEVSNEVRKVIVNLPRKHQVAWLPKENFQSISGAQIAREVQDSPSNISNILERWREYLWDPKFVNPEKKYMVGAYKLNKRVGFQRDRLHDTASFGEESRKHAFHLINAHHLFGAAVRPGMHFDVMSVRGKSIGIVFEDALTGRRSLRSERHANITPCDRLIGEGAPPTSIAE